MFRLLIIFLFVLTAGLGAPQPGTAQLYEAEEEDGFFDLFDLSSEERTLQNLGLENNGGALASIDKLAERYIESCFKQEPKDPTEQTIREYLCLCSATHMMENMEPQAIRDMFSLKKNARQEQERMLGLAVMPCLEKPARYMIKQQCLKDNNVTRGTKLPNKVCDCVADKVSESVSDQGNARDLIKNRALEDLLQSFTKRDVVRTQYRAAKRPCVYRFQFN